MVKGVYLAQKKSGEVYYRASFTYKNKHISLGSFNNETDANTAYLYALEVCKNRGGIEDFDSAKKLSFDKYIVISGEDV